MVRGEMVQRAQFALAGVLGCGFLASCGGTSGFEAQPQQASTYSLSSLGNLIAFNKLFPGSAPLPKTDAAIECPIVEVQDGTASMRVYKGADQANDSVRYGFSLGDIARECTKIGDQIQLKVGVEGRVLIGPAGTPGAFTVPIRIAVRNDNTQKVITSTLARVGATVASGETQTGFTYVSESISVPFVAHPDEDYVILVGFDANGKEAGGRPAPHRKKPRG